MTGVVVDGLVYENWEEKAFSIDEVKAIKGSSQYLVLTLVIQMTPVLCFVGLLTKQAKPFGF